ncbi:hypothetical protein A2761_02615 [Candidatus Kaiserbacteria bacterium RIFCSPHIGHO2_01_FULL_51_33]|uniref:DNA 3'-5' helicase n=1 Tax=Candidatus Kaiserbacteria bacterium RIFCSPLOWO2_01_FULL_51_21 TaxID=1798508 RepID=A0A1F6EDH9_9BACT|nr:MAG: hypothetical protein A2761_02615 [Candidatus Kaiserbacteria bacterium RIFCSPHIGHO2_01_FULL_51_33]OGG71670.1 MAG: hypothetical protein A3A35_00705 [Candidatus Kaiserbacteria bacterium RIFCSPLOWO2_01_FULL_51_21]
MNKEGTTSNGVKHLEGLNEAQKRAVLHKEGPLLIVAGAGAGKTRVITERIAELIRQGVAPENILAVTFTNKAAKEMRERVGRILGEDRGLNLPIFLYNRPFVATFHSLGVHIIRENARAFGLTRHFKIYDRSDSVRGIKTAMQEVGLDPKTLEPRKILNAISRQKGNAVTETEYRETVGNDFFERTVAAVWQKYEKVLLDEGALDFDDLLLKTLVLLRKNPETLRQYQKQWRYIHIDEYQDTNVVQNELAELLASKEGNLCVVGDIDQNIYSWRGADLENLLEFEVRHPSAEVVMLEENYRSTKSILAAANEVIRKNRKRKEKKLFTSNATGERISLYGASDETEEANFVAGTAHKLLRQGIAASDIAVLYRANFQSRVLEEAMLAEGMPYQVLGVQFFERKEIKDVLAFLRAALNPGSLADVKRVINVPPRGIGKVTLLAMFAKQEEKMNLGQRQKVAQFQKLLANIRESIGVKKPSDTIRFVIARSGLEEKLKAGSDDDLERLENIRELVTLATKYDSLAPEEGIEALLTDAALATDQDEMKDDRDSVKLMTVHAAKGLEFDVVFITGLEEGLFPHEGFEGEERDEEEERRLMYVALTRARKKIFLSFAAVRTIFGSSRVNVPSEFIIDLGDEHLEPVEERVEKKKIIYLE